MSAVTVSNVSKDVSLFKLQEFFSFCGTVKSINELDTGSNGSKSYQVNFTSEKAIDTALLLNDAELESVPVKVTKATLPTYEQAAKGDVDITDNKVQIDSDNATVTGDNTYDDISQEEKPKSAILAQLLASGYQISDDLIDKAVKYDNNKGFSTKFKSFLNDLDTKYLHSQDPDSKASKGINKAQNQFNSLSNQVQKSSYSQKLQHYFERAASTPYGVKVHDFYMKVSKEVSDVHKEALRLKELRKANEAKSSETSEATATAEGTS